MLKLLWKKLSFPLLNTLIITVIMGISFIPQLVSAGDTLITRTPKFSLEVSRQTLGQGEKFEVLVTLDSGVPSRGAQFDLSFDPRLVKVVSVTAGDYYSKWFSHKDSTYFNEGIQDNKSGTLQAIGACILGEGKTEITGTGIIARITLETTSDKLTGKSALELSQTFLALTNEAFNLAEIMSDTAANGSEIAVTGEGDEVGPLPPVSEEKETQTDPMLLDVVNVQTVGATHVGLEREMHLSGYLAYNGTCEVSFDFWPVGGEQGHKYSYTWQTITGPDDFSRRIVSEALGYGSNYECMAYCFQAKARSGGQSIYGMIQSFTAPLAQRPHWDPNYDYAANIGDVSYIGLWWNQEGPNGWIIPDTNVDGGINIGDVATLGMFWNETWASMSASKGSFSDKIRISWGTQSAYNAFAIYRNTVNQLSTATLIGTTVSNYFDDYNISSGGSYYYWLQYFAQSGDSFTGIPSVGWGYVEQQSHSGYYTLNEYPYVTTGYASVSFVSCSYIIGLIEILGI
jgi:hypothetical protein